MMRRGGGIKLAWLIYARGLSTHPKETHASLSIYYAVRSPDGVRTQGGGIHVRRAAHARPERGHTHSHHSCRNMNSQRCLPHM